MQSFQEQVNNLVFNNIIIENDTTKYGAYIEHKAVINVQAIKKIANKMYKQFQDKMDYESFLAEFQTQLFLASKRFAKNKTQEQLQEVLNNIETAASFLSYIRIVIKSNILDTYIQTGEVLQEKLQDPAFYDEYMKQQATNTTSPIMQWYYANKSSILTKHQVEFLEHLNRGTAVETYGKAHIARTKKTIMKRIEAAYNKKGDFEMLNKKEGVSA